MLKIRISGTRKELPIHQFLQQIPAWILEKVKQYHHFQFSLLQVLSQSQKARELFTHTPNLLWLLIIEKNNQFWSKQKLEKILSLKRHEIIYLFFPPDEILPYTVTAKQQLKLLNKISFNIGGLKEYKTIKQAITTPQVINSFKHYTTISIHLIMLIEKYPDFLGCHFLKLESSLNNKTFINCIREYKDTADLIIDIKRMAKILVIEDYQRQYKKLTSRQSIHKMHDKLVEQINKNPLLQTEYEFGFPKPKIKSNNEIIFISNAYELKTEGRELSHCVVSYSDMARKGHKFFYKVLKPQRGTLELSYQLDKYIINSFKLAKNLEPSKQSWKAVRKWLKTQNKLL